MRKIKVSAPGKLMLFGEHAVVWGRPCIVTAVDQRLSVQIEKTDKKLIEISAPDINVSKFETDIRDLTNPSYPNGVKFVLFAISNFFAKYEIRTGLKVSTKSEFSSLFGFGSSSAVTAGVVKALSEIFDIEVSKKGQFDIAYKSILDVQGVGSGFDVASAIEGGTIYFVRAGKVIKPIKTLGLNLVVGYTGVKADTTTLVREVEELHKSRTARIENIFNSIANIVEEAKLALENQNFDKLGSLMNENQKLLIKLGVSSELIDRLVGSANSAGAYGAKLSGAGGGDCMIALVNEKTKKDVKKAIEKAGGTILDVKANAEGVKVII